MPAISFQGDPRSAYEPGVCNIGAVEIAARRRAGHVGVLVTLVGFALLVAVEAPTASRLVLFLPADFAASGYLQARMHFCAYFGMRGVFNVSDRLRSTDPVLASAARARDRHKALEIIGLSAVAGAVVAIGAMLLPLSAPTSRRGGRSQRASSEQKEEIMFVRTGSATEVADGDMRVFDVAGTTVNVVNAGGHLYAIDDTCTHAGCSLADGELDGTTVTCECHGSQFDVTSGMVLRGPAAKPVRSRMVRVEGADLLVEA